MTDKSTIRPYVIIKCAISLDGCLDDTSDKRLILSNPEDLDRVDAMRASCDAILVGANTIRKDNPSLVLRSEARRNERVVQHRSPDPIKVTVTHTGKLNVNYHFFTVGTSAKYVYCSNEVSNKLKQQLAQCAEVVPMGSSRVNVNNMLADLQSRGVNRLLVEGGSDIITQFLSNDLVDELQISIAPFFIGESGAPQLVNTAKFPFDKEKKMSLQSVERAGDMSVLTYLLPHPQYNDVDVERLTQAIELSRKCTPVDRAFSVGALLFDKNDRLVATGFSRETDSNVHAEEVALNKATAFDLRGGTIYSSLEPCGRRLSGRKSCAERILGSGIVRVVFAMTEPPVFVEATGASMLRTAGIDVVIIDVLVNHVKEINAHLS